MNFLQRTIARIFRLGEVSISSVDRAFGIDPEYATPSRFGDYGATNAAVFAATSLRARNLAKLPLRIYRHDQRGEKVEVTNGALYDLMRRVNPHWTFRRLLRMTEQSLCAYGQAFWVLESGRAQRPTSRTAQPREIWWAHPSRMRIIPDAKEYIKGYVYSDTSGEIAFARDEVIWFKYDNPQNEFSGLSPIGAARMAIETANGALRSNRQIFDAGMQIAGIVAPADKAQTMSREQAEAVASMLDRRFRGADKAHRVAVLSQPVAFQSLSLTPKDAEFLELLKWGTREVAMVYGVPPEVIGDHEHATYSNVDAAEKALWWDTLIPEAMMIADELTEQLVPLFGAEADLIEFDTSEIDTLKEDQGKQIEQMSKLFAMGVPLNRLLQEMAPRFLPPNRRGYAWGDVGWLASGLVPVASSPTQEVPEAPTAAPAEVLPPPRPTPADVAAMIAQVSLHDLASTAVVVKSGIGEDLTYGSIRHEVVWRAWDDRSRIHENAIEEAMRDFFARQQASVLTKMKGQVLTSDFVPFTMAEWNKRLRTVTAPLITRAFTDGGEAALDTITAKGLFDSATVGAIRWLESRVQRFVRFVNDTTSRELVTAISDGIRDGDDADRIASRVRDVYQFASRSRSLRIARTETVAALNAGSHEAARQSGVVARKRWLAAIDNRTRDDHRAAHGLTVGLEDDFTVSGSTGPAPGQMSSADQNVNCRCTMIYEMD